VADPNPTVSPLFSTWENMSMKLALLGTDPDSLDLAAAAVSQGHAISWIGDVRPGDAGALSRLVANALDQSSEWELVLDRGTADAVIVGRGAASSELRAEQLKRIAAETMPMLVVHPACASVLPYYEVDMTRREMGGVVRHYNPIANHPIFAELATWVRDGHPEIGPIHQVTCERRVADTTRGNVVRCLERDVEPMAVVGGDMRRVSAMGPKIDQPSFASLQVQMICGGPASVRWSVGSPAGTDGELVMTLVGQHGSIRLTAFDAAVENPPSWRLETIGVAEQDRQTLEPFDAAGAAIREFVEAAAATSDAERRDSCTWNTATRAMEVVDAIELSLEKGRTLDVHQQQLTERLAFRGTMAALGCGLLLVGFGVLTLVTLFGTAEGNDNRKLFSGWSIGLLAVLAFFLLLQCAPLLVAKKKRSDDAGDEATGS
jgi:predicted dehydrogenase